MERIPDVSARRVVPAPDVRAEESEGKLLLRRRRFGGLRAATARFFKVSPDFTIQLDRLGAVAWRLIDGRRTVGEVRALLEASLPGETDLTARLGRFIGVLVSRKMVHLE